MGARFQRFRSVGLEAVTLDLALFGAGLGLLLFGAKLLVDGAGVAASRIRLSPFLTGVLIMGFGTSLPELAVGVDAALIGAGDIAVGSVIGSNLCNGILILGMVALLRPLPLAARIRRRELPTLIGASVLVAVMLRNGELARIEACVLLVGLAVYLYFALNESQEAAGESSPAETPHPARIATLCLVGFAALAVGAQWLVEGASLLARDLGVSEAAIAIGVVAVGTSLPELATCLVAARARADGLVVGNLVGSNLFNTLAILGVSGAVAPLRIIDLRAWELAAFVLAPFAILIQARRGQLGRPSGAILVAGYALVLGALIYTP